MGNRKHKKSGRLHPRQPKFYMDGKFGAIGFKDFGGYAEQPGAINLNNQDYPTHEPLLFEGMQGTLDSEGLKFKTQDELDQEDKPDTSLYDAFFNRLDQLKKLRKPKKD